MTTSLVAPESPSRCSPQAKQYRVPTLINQKTESDRLLDVEISNFCPSFPVLPFRLASPEVQQTGFGPKSERSTPAKRPGCKDDVSGDGFEVHEPGFP